MRGWTRTALRVTLALCLGAIWASDSMAGERSRNIVLLVSDDHSPDLGVYGNPVIQTPNLDQLAQEAGYRTARVGKFHNGPAATYAFEEVLPSEYRNSPSMVEN